MILNCDIGERGGNHPVDVELMSWIGLANLACGGHAGDQASVDAFRRLAGENDVRVSAHLSYPDRAHFGRVSMDLSPLMLEKALDAQWELLPDVGRVKFHGALYNDSMVDSELAENLAGWMEDRDVEEVMCPSESSLAVAAAAMGIRVLAEAFVERRYVLDPSGRLGLVSRSDPGASISNVAEALNQARDLVLRGGVVDVEGRFCPLAADTLCIHSDSTIALELTRAVHALLELQT